MLLKIINLPIMKYVLYRLSVASLVKMFIAISVKNIDSNLDIFWNLSNVFKNHIEKYKVCSEWKTSYT